MLCVQRHRKDEVRVVGAAEQETHVDRRGRHGQRRGEQRGRHALHVFGSLF